MDVTTPVLSGYSDLLFLRGPRAGAIVLAATFSNPRIGAAGLLSLAAAAVTAWLVGLGRGFTAYRHYVTNAVLTGLALGTIVGFSAAGAAFVAAAGAMTLVLTVITAQWLKVQCNLPPLSLPSVATIVVAEVAALRFSNLLHSADTTTALMLDDFSLPVPIAAWLRTFGAIVYSPSVPVGAAFALLLFAKSRILLLLAAGGYALGTAWRAWLLGAPMAVYADVYNYNFLLVAMALGGAFLTPSLGGYAIAATAVVVTTFFIDGITLLLAPWALPCFNLPFTLTVLGFTYALASCGSSRLATIVGATPEETLEIDLAVRRRFPEHRRRLQLPFCGSWTVWQACDDCWTHQGDYRHAYDFVITDADGSTHAGEGAALEEFYCFRKPVLSPVAGRVVRVVNELPDNRPGRVDRVHNWGNCVVIYDARGFHVELSHFAQDSIRVHEGDWVDAGTLLGLCGNSGFSPQPHLHVQVQATARVGDATLPFCFSGYFADEQFHAFGLPEKGTCVEVAASDPLLDRATDFVLDEQLEYEVTRGNGASRQLVLTVKMAIDGTHYFEADDGGRLYFGKHDRCLFLYRVEGRNEALAALYRACSMTPLVQARGARWRDRLPATATTYGLRRWLAQLVAAISPRAAECEITGRLDGHAVTTVIRAGLVTKRFESRVAFDGGKGPASIACDEFYLRRIDHDEMA
jgi:urea transporter